MDISVWIDRHAGFSPDKTAIRFADSDTSYGALAAQIARMAGTLRQGFSIKQGDRIAYLGRNHADEIALLFACARLGAIMMPLNWRLESPEHHEILTDCSPVLLLSGPGFEAPAAMACDQLPIQVAPLVELSKGDAKPLLNGTSSCDDPVLLCYTSGATGRPKGVLLDQNALFYNAVNSQHMHDMTSNDVVLTTLPLFHVGGINIQSLPVLHCGGTLVLHPAFNVSDVFTTLVQDQITLTVLVPAQLAPMMNDPMWNSADLSALRVISTGSTFVPRSLVQAINQRGIPVIQVYGSTETAPLATYQRVSDGDMGVGSVGKAALHCQMRIVDGAGADMAAGLVGEILIKGPNVMLKYWNAPKRSAHALQDGWFHTGDMGHLDSDGFLYVDDRKKDMIISGGENVYPAELENILAANPAIAEAAVVGASDEKWGEVAVAFVVTKPSKKMAVADVKGLFDGQLARFKHPKQVIFCDALPRNAMGKVVKDDLRQQVAEMRG